MNVRVIAEESSESDSDSSSSDASAYAVAGPSAAALRGRQLERQIDSAQFRHNDPSNFIDRVAAPQYRLTRAGESPTSTRSSNSTTSSMAVSVRTRSTASSFQSSSSNYSRAMTTPSLVGSSSSRKSDSSARTSRVDSVIEQPYTLNQGEEDLAELPESPDTCRLECLLKFLNCNETFDNIAQWDVHCRSHFQGILPSSAECPFDCDWSASARSTQQVEGIWRQRLFHMLIEHRGDDFAYTSSRPDRDVLNHLHRHRLIDDLQYRELRTNGRIDSERSSAVMNTARPGRDRGRNIGARIR